MSHVARIDMEIKDLECLKKAAESLGLKFVEGQTSYRWFNQHVGDYPLPENFKVSDLGKCEHALSIPGNSTAYEIGVVKRRDGKPGYTLLWDFWQGGYGLQAKVGKDGNLLKQSYAEAVAMKQLKGFRVQRTVKEGKVVLTAIR